MSTATMDAGIVPPPPETLYAFEADAARADFLDRRMRARLADSLSYIFEQGESYFSVTRERSGKFLEQLRSEPISPLAFSFYCDIVLAVEEDDIGEASNLIEALIALPPHKGGPAIEVLGDPKRDPTSARIARFVDTDPQTPFEIFEPQPHLAEACRAQINGAFALMDKADPALAAELRRLIREITLASGHKDPAVMTFDGASSFMLWGGIIINADRDDGPVDMVQMLAHEAAHNLIFAFCVDEPVLENGFEGRYSSPLREDLRPLEGIFHANYVVARMHRALKHLVDGGVLDAGQKEKAIATMARQKELFASGMETIRQHGKITATGAAVIQGASDYMASVG